MQHGATLKKKLLEKSLLCGFNAFLSKRFGLKQNLHLQQGEKKSINRHACKENRR
jgi:hypothetical protein